MTSRKITFALIVVVVLLGSSYLIKTILTEKEVTKVVEVRNEITGWGYTLDDRDTYLLKTNFDELKTVLEASMVDDTKYADLIAKLYIIDLYTIDNKINAYDIPCLEYVEPSIKENFKINILDTLYKNVIDNSNNKRNQELPVVKSITINETKEVKYTLNEVEYDAYQISLTWDYEKDLGYDTTGILTLIKQDKKIYVVKQEKVV